MESSWKKSICESVQSQEWKYIRYSKNENQSALNIIRAAKDLKLPLNKLLYQINDPDIALYRSFVEAPFRGEEAVYEELYHLRKDPQGTTNVIREASPALLKEMQEALDSTLRSARGKDAPKVLRYTHESKLEAQLQSKKK